MNRRTLTAFLAVAASAIAAAQAPPQPPVAVLYENARLIIGTAAPPIERGSFVVQNGAIRAIGPAGRVAVPSGTQRVDLAGKTVMPALVNVHVHIGYEGYATWQAKNHTPANVVDHLQRSAFYGTAATTSVGTSPIEQMRQVQADRLAGKLPPTAARLLFMPGFAPPNGGPDAVLRVATNELKVVNEVTTPAEARAAVQRLAAQHVRHVKAWYDDRRGSYPKLTPETYLAILDEAHKQQMTAAHPRHRAGRPEVRGQGRYRRARAHGAARAARRRVPGAGPREEALLGDGDRPGRSDRGLQSPIRSSSRRCRIR